MQKCRITSKRLGFEYNESFLLDARCAPLGVGPSERQTPPLNSRVPTLCMDCSFFRTGGHVPARPVFFWAIS